MSGQSVVKDDKWAITVTNTTFAQGPLRDRVLIAFLVMRETGKTSRVLYSNPEPKHFIVNRFPVLQFVFPTAVGCSEGSLSFTFVLTTSTGERVYGHTLHTVTGDAMVCLSAYPWCGFFQHVMHAYRVNGPDENGKRMIRHLLECTGPHIPKGGAHFPIPIGGRRLMRPSDNFAPFVDTKPVALLSVFSTETLFEVLAALLQERRVVVVGPTFGAVSGVMLSLLALLSPFEWQHILTTVLPDEMGLVLSSPTPFFVGLVESQVPMLESMPIESVVVVRLHLRAHTHNRNNAYKTLICSDVVYHGDDVRVRLPRTGRSSRTRWQLELLRMSSALGSSVTLVDFDGDHDSYQVAGDRRSNSLAEGSRANLEAIHVMQTYYASWLGPAVAEALLPADVAAPSSSGGVNASLKVDGVVLEAAAERPFFECLVSSQCYAELLDRLVSDLDVTRARGTPSPRSPRTHKSWKENDFLVSLVHMHAHLFPVHMADWRSSLPSGAGNVTRCTASMQTNRNGSRTTQRNSARERESMEQRVGVGSLFLRTIRCCQCATADDDESSDDMFELHGVTPGGSNTATPSAAV